MSRTQIFSGIISKSLAVGGTKYFITPTPLFVKSMLLQADVANLGVVSVFDSLGVLLCELTAGRAGTFLGDNMDNGTAAKFDVSSFQASSSVGGDIIIMSVASGL